MAGNNVKCPKCQKPVAIPTTGAMPQQPMQSDGQQQAPMQQAPMQQAPMQQQVPMQVPMQQVPMQQQMPMQQGYSMQPAATPKSTSALVVKIIVCAVAVVVIAGSITAILWYTQGDDRNRGMGSDPSMDAFRRQADQDNQGSRRSQRNK